MRVVGKTNVLMCLFCLVVSTEVVLGMSTVFTYQGKLIDSNSPADRLYDFQFKLYDANTAGKQKGKTIDKNSVDVVDGYFTVALDFCSEVFDGNDCWLEIAVGPHTPFPMRKTTLSPRQQLTPVPYALHALRAEQLTGMIDVSQITGLLGQHYTTLFPDVLYNTASLWINWPVTGCGWTCPGLILLGAGVDIDRIEGFDPQSNHADNPGFAMEHPFIFEVDPADADHLENCIAIDYSGGPVTCAFIVPFLSGEAYLYVNVWNNVFTDETPGTDGRIRFTFSCLHAPDTTLTINMLDPNGFQPGDFGSTGAYDPETDRKVEIDGIDGQFYPEVLVDTTERTLTFTYSSNEGAGIYYWVKAVVEGTNDQREISVIRLGAEGEELERDNYSGCFPLQYEILDGFGLDTTLRARVVVSYNIHQPG
ncbi:MAG: hypothetical protein JXN61_00040 [Sedimentisphaerales bacterium]|nr:hypothetical protein [Sedimentisphaerales bacterium]